MITMNPRFPGWWAAPLLAVATPLLAHHSFAMFDNSRKITLKGVVREFQWTNPHSWVQLLVKNEKGETEEWTLEALSPNVLRRMGWKRNSLKPGDDIVVIFNPLRDGSHGGNLVTVTMANGQTIGGQP
jgi:hypothetical protein